ncbi:isoprenyl transferase [bacterium]|nr:isoprenyl transferase [bacterium]
MSTLDPSRIPAHVAIIMDGNGRWARKRGLIRSLGHENGVDALRRIATRSAELGIRYLTVYAFSTENWQRPRAEVDALMGILVSALKKELKTLKDNNIRLNAIGDLDSLPKQCRKELEEVRSKTASHTHMTLTLALSYSAREELVRAARTLAEAAVAGTIAPADIDATLLRSALYSHPLPDPDLLIRTSGEYRISNYLLWQIAYAELYFSDKLWPDFTADDLDLALLDYQSRDRRFGLTQEQLNALS